MKFISIINNKKIFYFICLLIFSISINQYYGYIGVFPIDSFFIFDTGYRTLNGYYPFKDFWVTTGPLLDIIQAIFFKILGVSWFSYVLHASFFNFIIVFATFHTLIRFQLNIHFCFFYALLVSVIAYPIAGTPFVDHHSMIFSLLCLFSFILALKTKLNLYWFLLPIFIGLAFLSKQTPAAYVGIIIAVSCLIHFFYNFNLKKIIFLISGSFFIIICFLLFLFLNKIPFSSFYEQYILFPLAIGGDRISNFFFPIEFNRLITRFKLIHFSQLILIIVIIKNIFKNYKYLKKDEFILLTSIVFTSYALIFHQLMTLNQKFIFFIIPILLGFSHIYYKRNFNEKNYIIFILIFLGIGSTIYYKISYGDSRKFQELENVNLQNYVDAEIIDKKLKNLKWITPNYSKNPNFEIELLKKTIKILKNDNRNKMLITHYQFIASLLPEYTNSPNRSYTENNISFPKKDALYFDSYKKFFIDQIIKNNIEIIYIIKPIDKYVFDSILDENCITNNKVNDILNSYEIISCDQLKKKT